jgi:cytoskeletal protein RodZ
MGGQSSRHSTLPDGTGLGRAPRRRRRGRGWIALVVILVILGVLFAVGDQIARVYAQNMIATKIQSSGFPEKPSVTIQGFPFLTQVAEHDIRTIDMSANNVQEGKLDISSVQATATGVHINSSFNGATIDHISGTALITFSSIVSAAGAQGATITADPSAGPNAANVSVGPLSATAQVVRSGANRISVRMEGLAGIPASVVGSLPNYTFNVPQLPAGLEVQGISVTSQGISISIAAQNTTLSQ